MAFPKEERFFSQRTQSPFKTSNTFQPAHAKANVRLFNHEANSDDAFSQPTSNEKRATDAMIGGAGRSLASDVNTAASLYDLTQGGRDTMLKSYQSDYGYGLKQAQRDLEQMLEDGARPRDIADQQAVVDDFQRKYDAVSKAGDIQRQATQATYDLADEIKSSADSRVSQAKQGLDSMGQNTFDAIANLTQMGIDNAKSSLLIGGLGSGYESDEVLKKLADSLKLVPYAGRRYGEHTQTARWDGASPERASTYGAAAAITDARIEKWFDGLNGIYGKSLTDKLASGFSRMVRNNEFVQKIAHAGFNDIGESLESAATDIADQLLKSVYNGKGIRENLTETEWGRVGRNALVNAIVGILSGDTAFDANE